MIYHINIVPWWYSVKNFKPFIMFLNFNHNIRKIWKLTITSSTKQLYVKTTQLKYFKQTVNRNQNHRLNPRRQRYRPYPRFHQALPLVPEYCLSQFFPQNSFFLFDETIRFVRSKNRNDFRIQEKMKWRKNDQQINDQKLWTKTFQNTSTSVVTKVQMNFNTHKNSLI